jgi:predicted AlkP superfamily pyrophosphatase or phosphodiesterase
VADKIIEIVEAYQPEFLIAQLGKTDDVFHREGPSSPAVVPMLRETDVRMKKLVEYLQARGYGIVVLADHGQHDIEGAPEGQMKGTHGTDSPKDVLVPCTWIS